jgi:hypothetical protein
MPTAGPQIKINKYFSTVDDDDDDLVCTDRMELVDKAIKKEWWYDMFDVDGSQFDVSFIKESLINCLFFLFRLNFRVNLNYFELYYKNVN